MVMHNVAVLRAIEHVGLRLRVGNPVNSDVNTISDLLHISSHGFEPHLGQVYSSTQVSTFQTND